MGKAAANRRELEEGVDLQKKRMRPRGESFARSSQHGPHLQESGRN